MLVIKLIFAILIIVLSGHLFLVLITKREVLDIGPLIWLALSFTLGLGLVSLQMFFYSLVGIGFSVPAIALPWIVANVIQYFYFRDKRPASSRSADEGTKFSCFKSLKGLNFLGWLSLFIIASQVLFAFYTALLMPFAGWDAWAIWFLKAKVLFLVGALPSYFFLDESYLFSHHDYPLLLPLMGSWIYLVIGSVHEIMAKVLFPLQFVSMLTIFHFIVSRKSTRSAAFLFTALLSLVPLIMTQAGGLPIFIGWLSPGDYVGYADITIALFFMSAAGFIYLYMIEKKPPYFIISAVFLGFGAWTKNEGLVFAIIALFVVAVYLFLERRGRELGDDRSESPRVIWAFFILPIAIIAPWMLYKLSLGLSSEYAGAISVKMSLGNLQRTANILKTFAWAFFVNYELVGIVWYAYLISSIIRFRKSLSRPMIFLHAMLLLQLLIYIFVYTINPHKLELRGLLEVSIIKRTLQILPLAMLIASINLSSLFSKIGVSRDLD